VLANDEQLDVGTALELTEVFLRFSDERLASADERHQGLVVDGRYAQEAAIIARIVLKRQDCGRARHALAWAHELLGEDAAAANEFCAAIPLLNANHDRQNKMADAARACAIRVLDQPELLDMVEKVIAEAFERREN